MSSCANYIVDLVSAAPPDVYPGRKSARISFTIPPPERSLSLLMGRDTSFRYRHPEPGRARLGPSVIMNRTALCQNVSQDPSLQKFSSPSRSGTQNYT
jgi:hypothetical protein